MQKGTPVAPPTPRRKGFPEGNRGDTEKKNKKKKNQVSSAILAIGGNAGKAYLTLTIPTGFGTSIMAKAGSALKRHGNRSEARKVLPKSLPSHRVIDGRSGAA
ncbi:hypothetical protein RRF57_006659 [Xylaria bambusicola]|uniref:Uncharacterized protein n=1 Tax=Xylaria bambusicola TaxID=326684 RepID=A0AAN7USX2_9PEZI